MKLLSLAQALLSLGAMLVAAAPGASPDHEVISINNLEKRDDLDLDLEKRSGTHWEATLQVWNAASNCPGTPGQTWFPVGFSTGSEGPSPCYEWRVGGGLNGIKSTLLTGPWGSNCKLRAYPNAGCVGDVAVIANPGQCLSSGGGTFYSVRVHCA